MSEKDPAKRTMKERMATAVMRWNLPAIAVLVGIEIACVVILKDKTLIAVISTATGGVITALINERLVLIQYMFGSSKGSEDKQKTIDRKLTEKAKKDETVD